MVLSARNGIKGKVTDVKLGEVMASVKIEVTEPGVITAVITRESAEALELAAGDDVEAVIKSTEVMVAKEWVSYFLTIFYFFNYNFLNFLDYFYYF